jgi:uncharacterized protein (TIGR02328 family)
MRLWHFDLLPVLPWKQLVSQWRECCAIAGAIAKHGTPNHQIVNKVLSSRGDFIVYTFKVWGELEKRGYKVSERAVDAFKQNMGLGRSYFETCATHFNLFPGWFNHRYLMQCFYNLQEKFDCGMITAQEWKKIQAYVLGWNEPGL